MKPVSTLLFLLAFICVSYSGNQLFKRLNPSRLAFAQAPIETEISNQATTPTILEIPSLSLTLPIFPASIENNVWEMTDTGVSYLQASPLPGENGNSVIYGHNFTNILGKLPQVTPGDTIKISFADKTAREFTIQTAAVVDPENPTVLAPTKEPALTIYTCTGFFDTKRFVVKAVLTD